MDASGRITIIGGKDRTSQPKSTSGGWLDELLLFIVRIQHADKTITEVVMEVN